MTSVQIKRIYDQPSPADGLRVLVDRLWPRGVKKKGAQVDLWAQDLAPNVELRKWFAHDEAKFDEFRRRYLRELDEKRKVIRELLEQTPGRTITLLFAARHRSCNHAVVLQEFLSKMTRRF